MNKSKLFSILLVAVAIFFNIDSASAQTTEKGVTIIELTQTNAQFYTENLTLAPGKYQFRVINKDVDKDLGFVIQKASDKNADVMKTAVANSFTTALVSKGSVQYTGVVELGKGEYVYSCPLNPTPHYTITVK